MDIEKPDSSGRHEETAATIPDSPCPIVPGPSDPFPSQEKGAEPNEGI
jgi:hypothetical protein